MFSSLPGASQLLRARTNSADSYQKTVEARDRLRDAKLRVLVAYSARSHRVPHACQREEKIARDAAVKDAEERVLRLSALERQMASDYTEITENILVTKVPLSLFPLSSLLSTDFIRAVDAAASCPLDLPAICWLQMVKCPKCQGVLDPKLTPGDCFAFKCSNLGCGVAFCGFCMQDQV